MADRIEGVAILKGRAPEETLIFVCVRENGDRKPFFESIPVRAEDEIGPERAWVYRWRRGTDWLDVWPSVKISTTRPGPNGENIPAELFHNEGRWAVRFERRDGDGELARLRELNPTLLPTPESGFIAF